MSFDYYSWTASLYSLNGLLQDRQSKDIFWARLRYEAEPTLEHALNICAQTGIYPQQTLEEAYSLRNSLSEIKEKKGRIILYGAGVIGMEMQSLIKRSGLPADAFCDKNKAGQKCCGLPVISPEELMDHRNEYYVIITTGERYIQEIRNGLLDAGLPAGHILTQLEPFISIASKNMYFELADHLRTNGLFIDAGGYDGADSIRYHKLTGRKEILIFEPDSEMFQWCRENLRNNGLDTVKVMNVCMGSHSGKSIFVESKTGGSYLSDQNDNKAQMAIIHPLGTEKIIPIVALDNLEMTTISFIKMDIEGAEFDALRGGEKTIRRDKPLLAICVYHRKGDMPAIMDYLHTLVPEYQFWLRHYGLFDDTVLYAAV